VTAPYLLVEENLRRAMRFYGTTSERAEVREIGGVEIVTSGMDFAMFNPAMLTSPVAERNELDRRIAIPAVHFSQRHCRWSYWVCEDLLAPPLRRVANDCFARRGLRRVLTVPGMLADGLRPPVRPLPKIECRQTNDAATRAAFAHITAIAFDLPFPATQQIYESERGWREDDLIGYVGFADSHPVCTSAITISKEVVGFYSVGTLPLYRRRGYAEALMRNIYDQVRSTIGLERIVLQSTPAGLRLYERMGFRTVTKFSIYVSM
jgi:Acetyltransferases